MRNEIKWMIYILTLGVVLTAYAHNNFATKREVDSIKSILNRLDQRVYDIHSKFIPNKEKPHEQGKR